MQQARKKFKTNKIRMTESGDIFFLHDAETFYDHYNFDLKSLFKIVYYV